MHTARTRRLALLGATSLVLAAGSVLPSAFAAGNASLSGSDFEIENDANLTRDSASPSMDWGDVPNATSVMVKADKASGTGDDSFGQGTKEDSAVPTVVSGSIPPNKSDLKFFGAYQEGTSATGFLHLFWSRVQDPSGTTNMDFEFNQSQNLSSNGITPVRTAGDLLITYDLENGGTVATIGKRTWSGSAWGPYTEFGDGDAIGTINSSAITNADSAVDSSPATTLGGQSARTFGEASIRLSSILGTGSCTSFGSAYLKSRSSDSFTAAVKDFIAPLTVNITNCGRIDIIKTDDAANRLDGAAFTLYTDVNNAPGVVADGDPNTAGVQAMTCTTSSSGSNNGTCSITSVPFGTYWVVETTTPTGYETASPQKVTVSSQSGAVSVTFVDPRQRGAIKVTKTYKDKSNAAANYASPHSGVTFTLKQAGATITSGITNSSGVVCFDNLLFGSYSVVESQPANFQTEAGATTAGKAVTVDDKASCSDATYVGEGVSFVNTPLSSITVSFTSTVTGVNGPATASQISCTGLSSTPADQTPNAWDDTSESFPGLAPGTYTCTVVIDP